MGELLEKYIFFKLIWEFEFKLKAAFPIKHKIIIISLKCMNFLPLGKYTDSKEPLVQESNEYAIKKIKQIIK